ncbi:MAG: hypothetical protein ACXVI6_03400 [Candidatus Aminicenantales bacterium]
MRKTNLTLILTLAVLVLAAAASAFAQKAEKVNLAGKWTGYTVLGDGNRADLNLILEKAGETYTGKVNDDVGMIPEMVLKNVSFKDPTLSFEIELPEANGSRLIKIELKLEGETLKGSWVDPDDNSNVIELTRKK